ncbi:MAG: stage II sporulation protein R [Firmicutes bacterium]|nr:stage II sporulation protein R [Bacillota bacterium]
MRKISVSLVLALVITSLLSMYKFDRNCQQLRDGVFRLHILANSDSSADQQLKLTVRDAVIDLSESLFDGCETMEDAVAAAKENLSLIQQTAERTVTECGANYSVNVSVGQADFDTRHYEQVTLPAGSYTALRIVIGEGNGHNWWCVMFPQMCLPAASQSTELERAVDKNSAEIAENYDKYEVKFKIVEIFEQLRG